MENRILFVDDERSILRSIERLFFDCDYELFVAESGEEGLKIMDDNPVDIVVSDMRMPGMDGHQFLKRVKELYPATTRLILSGYADEKEILNSLIDGSSSVYLFKPWDGEELVNKIERIFEARQLISNPALMKIVNGLGNLSVVIGIYGAISQLIEQEADIQEIAKVIETDPTVTASVLRVVNSAFYNVKTGSVVQAITFLGLPVIKAIVLSCSLFQSTNSKVPLLSMSSLARQAMITNLYMTNIYSQLLKKKVPDTLSTAGLLHNLGLLMLLHYFPDKYKGVVEKVQSQEGEGLLAAGEKEIFGITHAQLGGHLLNWWSIPYATVECALFYQEPLHQAVLGKEAVGVIHLANYYTWKQNVPFLAGSLDDRVFSVLGIKQQACEQLIAEIKCSKGGV